MQFWSKFVLIHARLKTCIHPQVQRYINKLKYESIVTLYMASAVSIYGVILAPFPSLDMPKAARNSVRCFWWWHSQHDNLYWCACPFSRHYSPNHQTVHTRNNHDDVIKWKHFPRDWPFVWGIHWSPVNSPHKGQWRGALMFSLICVWINDWVNNREAGDLRRYRAHYDVIVMMHGPFCIVVGYGLI